MVDYPTVTAAALLILRDGGGINRHRTERQARRDIAGFIARQPDEMVAAIDAWLATLTSDDLQEVCCGDRDEAERLMATAPPFTDQLLEAMFETI